MVKLIDIVGSEFEPETNHLVISCRGSSLSDDPEDSHFYQGEMFGSLGITARPYGPTEAGSVEGIISLQESLLGMRDPRIGALYGDLSPGDTAIHCTHENESTRMLLKGEDRQASIVVDKSNGKQMVFALDGSEETVSIMANGAAININKDGSVSILSKWGSGIVADQSGTWVKGAAVKLGGNPTLPMNLLTPTPQVVPAGTDALGGATVPTPLSTFPKSIILTP